MTPVRRAASFPTTPRILVAVLRFVDPTGERAAEKILRAVSGLLMIALMEDALTERGFAIMFS
jgi:hypothetical protein